MVRWTMKQYQDAQKSIKSRAQSDTESDKAPDPPKRARKKQKRSEGPKKAKASAAMANPSDGFEICHSTLHRSRRKK